FCEIVGGLTSLHFSLTATSLPALETRSRAHQIGQCSVCRRPCGHQQSTIASHLLSPRYNSPTTNRQREACRRCLPSISWNYFHFHHRMNFPHRVTFRRASPV